MDLGSLPNATDVEISIYDGLGRRIATEVLKGSARTQRYVWNGTNDTGRAMPSGLYLYRVRAGDAIATGGMTLVK